MLSDTVCWLAQSAGCCRCGLCTRRCWCDNACVGPTEGPWVFCTSSCRAVPSGQLCPCRLAKAPQTSSLACGKRGSCTAQLHRSTSAWVCNRSFFAARTRTCAPGVVSYSACSQQLLTLFLSFKVCAPTLTAYSHARVLRALLRTFDYLPNRLTACTRQC